MGILVLIVLFGVVFSKLFSNKIDDVEESDWGSREFFKGVGGYGVLVVVAVIVLFIMFAASEKPNSEVNKPDPNYHSTTEADWDDYDAPSYNDDNK